MQCRLRKKILLWIIASEARYEAPNYPWEILEEITHTRIWNWFLEIEDFVLLFNFFRPKEAMSVMKFQGVWILVRLVTTDTVNLGYTLKPFNDGTSWGKIIFRYWQQFRYFLFPCWQVLLYLKEIFAKFYQSIA